MMPLSRHVLSLQTRLHRWSILGTIIPPTTDEGFEGGVLWEMKLESTSFGVGVDHEQMSTHGPKEGLGLGSEHLLSVHQVLGYQQDLYEVDHHKAVY